MPLNPNVRLLGRKIFSPRISPMNIVRPLLAGGSAFPHLRPAAQSLALPSQQRCMRMMLQARIEQQEELGLVLSELEREYYREVRSRAIHRVLRQQMRFLPALRVSYHSSVPLGGFSRPCRGSKCCCAIRFLSAAEPGLGSQCCRHQAVIPSSAASGAPRPDG